MKVRDFWLPEDGGPAPLTAEEAAQGEEDRPQLTSSPRFLLCERCERPAVQTSSDARARTSGWRLPLYCDDCESWWARMLS